MLRNLRMTSRISTNSTTVTSHNIDPYYLMSNFIVFAALICGAMSGTTARLIAG